MVLKKKKKNPTDGVDVTDGGHFSFVSLVFVLFFITVIIFDSNLISISSRRCNLDPENPTPSLILQPFFWWMGRKWCWGVHKFPRYLSRKKERPEFFFSILGWHRLKSSTLSDKAPSPLFPWRALLTTSYMRVKKGDSNWRNHTHIRGDCKRSTNI